MNSNILLVLGWALLGVNAEWNHWQFCVAAIVAFVCTILESLSNLID
jgi:hypothetical protein